jgi:uncharacterized protein YaeQ
MYRFELEVSDTDRGFYESLDLRLARHPSESSEYLLTRLLAYVLNAQEGIDFTSGLFPPAEPAIAVHDHPGATRLGIEIGQPSPERLQKALGQSEAVAVYTYKSADQLATSLRASGDARLAAVRLYAIDARFLAGLEADLDRRNRWTLMHTEGDVFITIDERTHEGAITPIRIED